jgi:hypothetical protein
MARLSHVQIHTPQPVAEVIRVGMTSFLTLVLSMKTMAILYHWLPGSLRPTLRGLAMLVGAS